jgi:8-oxo-dGTP diphosphatase
VKRTNYVVGFMFDGEMRRVALIRKEKPAWQRGKLNGIGGKVEDGETPEAAMAREFKEEARYPFLPPLWKHFCAMSGVNNDGSSFGIDFFFCQGNPERIDSNESEFIYSFPVSIVVDSRENVVGNVPWLVAMAVDFGIGVHPPSHVEVSYSPKEIA